MYFILFILLLYVILIFSYRIGWEKLSHYKEVQYTPFVSIVIAMRNEEKNVKRLLKEIINQEYSKEKYEIIIVDDHSTDDTLVLLNEFKSPILRVLSLGDNDSGKKKAINKAISLSKGKIIITTDADCSVKPYWIKKLAACFVNKEIRLVAGPVDFHKTNNTFCNLQSLEFSSLIGSSAGAIGINKAILCNGANLAFRKDIFLHRDNISNNKIASGDDVFLLHSLKKLFKKSIFFIKDKDVIVTTNACITLKQFINQRKRWAAKSTRYTDLDTVIVSYIILLTNFTLVSLLVITIFNLDFFVLFLFFYLVKFFVDSLILYPVLHFFSRKDLVKWIFPFGILYSFYIIFIVVNSFSTSFTWKERTHIK